MKVKEMVGPCIGAFVVGGIVFLILAFKMFGVVKASDMKDMVKDAVVETKATVCAAQFMADPALDEHKEKVASLSSWEVSNYIEKGGWNKIPGFESADYGVKGSCAGIILEDLKQ